VIEWEFMLWTLWLCPKTFAFGFLFANCSRIAFVSLLIGATLCELSERTVLWLDLLERPMEIETYSLLRLCCCAVANINSSSSCWTGC
jgi:hypothetical protein